MPTWGPSPGAQGAVTGWAERRGAELRLLDAEGATGLGELAPLPGYSRETLADALGALEALDPRQLPAPRGGEPGEALLTRLAASPGVPALPSSARFALETALLDLAGRRDGRPLHELLGAREPPPLPLSALAGSPLDPAAERTVLEAGRAGYSVVKLKLDGRRVDAALPALRVLGALGPRLRLDANGSLDPATSLATLSALAELGPELLEEPVPEAALPGLAGAALPLALDESLQDPGAPARLDALLPRLPIVAVVLKPAAIGGLARALELAAWASARGLDVTVSHLFDGPIGLAAAIALGLAVGSRSRPSGLCRHAGLAAFPRRDIPQLEGPRARGVPLPGLGLSLAAEPPGGEPA